MRTLGAVAFLGCLCLGAAERDSSSPAENVLPSRKVTLNKTSISLYAALALVEEQTGNRVVDRRLAKNDVALNLALSGTSFWQVLETIAAQANTRISPYQPDSVIALVDGPYRRLPRYYHGPFRTSVKRIALDRDLETESRSCNVHLELAWEPWFLPFYVDVRPAKAAFSADAQGKVLEAAVRGQGQVSVSGRTAIEVELRLPAPDRSAARIDLVTGSFRVIGPTKMLTFTFDPLKPVKAEAAAVRQEQEGVTVSLTQVAAKLDRWTVEVVIDNPPGGPRFESYQSWLDNNQIYLEKGQGNKRQRFPLSSPDDMKVESVTAPRAVLRYQFTTADRRRPPPGKLADWRLVCRTPGRIVEAAVPYEFKALGLP